MGRDISAAENILHARRRHTYRSKGTRNSLKGRHGSEPEFSTWTHAKMFGCSFVDRYGLSPHKIGLGIVQVWGIKQTLGQGGRTAGGEEARARVAEAEESPENIKMPKELTAVLMMNRIINRVERTCRSGGMEAGWRVYLTCIF